MLIHRRVIRSPADYSPVRGCRSMLDCTGSLVVSRDVSSCVRRNRGTWVDRRLMRLSFSLSGGPDMPASVMRGSCGHSSTAIGVTATGDVPLGDRVPPGRRMPGVSHMYTAAHVPRSHVRATARVPSANRRVCTPASVPSARVSMVTFVILS
jgi:hypothetical protein